MRPTGIGIGGSFSVPASFKLDNVNTPFKNVDVKIDTGETIFLGCPKEQINDAYLQELEDTFHIASELNAKNIR